MHKKIDYRELIESLISDSSHGKTYTPQELYKLIPDLKIMYKNDFNEKTFKNMVSMIFNKEQNRIKDKNSNFENNNIETNEEKIIYNLFKNKNSLSNIIKKIIEAFNCDRSELYNIYSIFLKYFPNLKYSTYSRLVRSICPLRESEYGMECVTEEKIKENIHEKNIIKDVKNVMNKKNNERKNMEKTVDSMYDGLSIKNSIRSENFKRMIVLSDLHCGHLLGLTPPSWQIPLENETRENIAALQREAWAWYSEKINEIGNKCDVLIINGDVIDGDGFRSGGAELITTDRLAQAQIACECISLWDPNSIFMTRGTPYHVGKSETFEDVVAEKLNAYISDSLNINFNNKNFNFVHKSDGTSVPYSKATQIVKSAIINELVANHQNVDKADVVIRSHLHYFVEYKDSQRMAVVTPALQIDSRYGRQQCQGIIDFGFICIDVYDSGEIILTPHIAKFENNKIDFIKI